MTKKQFTDTICKTFDLKGITPNSFVYAVNCILIGIVMVEVPGRKAYKLFFTIFPLWEASLKECLNMPMFQQAIVNTKNMDIYLPESMTEDNSSFTIHQCSLQIPFVPARNFSHTEIIDFLYDQTITNPSISVNFVLKMKAYKLIYNIELIGNVFRAL